MLEFDRIYNSDCIEGMKQIESGGGSDGTIPRNKKGRRVST